MKVGGHVTPRKPVGSGGSIRDHCSSENQKKSAIANASFAEELNHCLDARGIRLLGPDPSICPVLSV